MTRFQFAVPAILSLALGACSNEPALTGKELALRTTDISTTIAREIAAAIQFIDGIDELDSASAGLDVVDGLMGGDQATGARGGTIPPPPADGEEDGIDPDKVAAEVKDFLDKYVFVSSQLESEEGDRASYLIRGEVVCVEDFLAGSYDCVSAPCPVGDLLCEQKQQQYLEQCEQDRAADQKKCVSDVDAVAIRLDVRTHGEGVEIHALIGPDRSQLVVLTVLPGHIALDVDLAELKAALVHISSVFDEKPMEMPEVMQGGLSLTLNRNADADYTLAAGVPQDVHVRLTTPKGGTVDIQVEQSDPAAQVRVQGNEKKITASVSVGAVAVSLPFAEMFDSGDGAFAVELAGLDGSVELADAANAIVLRGLGLGDAQSRVRHDQVNLVTIDVNKDHGRHFDLDVTDATGLPLLTFSPGVEVEAYVNLGHLDPFLAAEEEPAPDELRDQTYRFALLADDNAPALLPVKGADGTDAMKVAHGTLSVSSSAVTATLAVADGQCLLPVEPCAEESNAVIECMAAAICP